MVPIPANKEALITVSMKSGLRDRNNDSLGLAFTDQGTFVSMKSGLGDRNNGSSCPNGPPPSCVSQ